MKSPGDILNGFLPKTEFGEHFALSFATAAVLAATVWLTTREDHQPAEPVNAAEPSIDLISPRTPVGGGAVTGSIPDRLNP